MGSLNVVEACLVDNYNDKWTIDSEATNHIFYSLQWIKQSSLLSKGQRKLKLGNEDYVSVMVVRLVGLCFLKLYVYENVYLFWILRGI